jgi:aldehyde dehydrogenase (NAD+)
MLDAQREHFLSDDTKSYYSRNDQLHRMERLLAANKEALCAALHEDFGKPLFEQLFEITVPMGVICDYRENLKTQMAPEPV